jgi:hypothetical protein
MKHYAMMTDAAFERAAREVTSKKTSTNRCTNEGSLGQSEAEAGESLESPETNKPLENQGFDMSRLLAALAGMTSLIGDEGLATFSTDQQKSRVNDRRNLLGSGVPQSVAQTAERVSLEKLHQLFSTFSDIPPHRLESIILQAFAIASEASGFALERTPPINRLRSALPQSNP